MGSAYETLKAGYAAMVRAEAEEVAACDHLNAEYGLEISPDVRVWKLSDAARRHFYPDPLPRINGRRPNLAKLRKRGRISFAAN